LVKREEGDQNLHTPDFGQEEEELAQEKKEGGTPPRKG